MDQLLALKIFVRIAESGSFAKAADSLNQPRSTASKLIADLENHLGTILIQRTTRRITITPEGAAYYERATRLIGDLEEMDAAARKTKTQPRGRLRVDIGSSPANLILIPALPVFMERYPEIELQLGVNDRPADIVGEGIDCVVRGGPLADSSLIARRLCELEMVTCATPTYLESRPRPSHPTDLEVGHHTVRYFSSLTGKETPFFFQRAAEQIVFTCTTGISVNESTAYNAAILAGLGVGQTFRFAVDTHLQSGALVPVLEDWTRPSLSLFVAYPSSRHLNARARVFVDWLVDVFSAI